MSEEIQARVNIDPDDLSIDEMELAEDITGVSFDDILAGNARMSKVLRAFALIYKRRLDPSATAESIGKLTARELAEFLGAGPLDAQPQAESNVSVGSPRSRKRPA